MTSKGPTRRRSSVSKGKDTREKEQLKKKGKKEELMQEKLKKLEQRKYLLTSLPIPAGWSRKTNSKAPGETRTMLSCSPLLFSTKGTRFLLK
jgi:hypothetical protein